MDGSQSLPPLEQQLAQGLIEDSVTPQNIAEHASCNFRTGFSTTKATSKSLEGLLHQVRVRRKGLQLVQTK